MKLLAEFVFLLKMNCIFNKKKKNQPPQLTIHYAGPLSRVFYSPKVHLQLRTIKLFPLTWVMYEEWDKDITHLGEVAELINH